MDIGELVHLYLDGAFSRRELVRRVAGHTGSIAAAAAVLASMGVAEAQQSQVCPADVRVPEDAPDVNSQVLTFSGQASDLFAYLTQPSPFPDNPQPAVLVIHENRGLTDYIKDVTRRLARAGYVALGIDLLSRQGGTDQFPDPVQATQAYGRTTPDGRLQDMLSALAYLKTLDFVQTERLGAVGFCAGGGNIRLLIGNTGDLAAAVAFYGPSPGPEDVSQITAPLLGNYAQLDTGTTNSVLPLVSTMLSAKKSFEFHVYEGVNHAFHNDTGPAYDATAACEAWNLTLGFFGRHLRAAA